MRELMAPISSFTRPSTFGEATARIRHNLSYFRSTYAMLALLIIFLAMLVLLIIFLSCLLHFEIVIFYVIVLWVWLFIVLGVLGVYTVFLFLHFGIWLNVFVSILIGFAIVAIHATFRGTEDLPSDLHDDDDDV